MEKEKIKKWAEFLRKMYDFSGGVSDRERSEKLDFEDFEEQAERLVTGKVKLFSKRKVSKTDEEALDKITDEKIREYHKNYIYYSTLAQSLDPVNDTIIANIISRLADYYMLKTEGYGENLFFEKNKSNLKALIDFSNYIGKIIGLRKEHVVKEEKYKSPHEELKEWFKRFSFEEILKEKNEEYTKKEKQKKKIKMRENKILKKISYKIVENKDNDLKFKKILSMLNENQKKKILDIISRTYNYKTTKEIANKMGMKKIFESNKNIKGLRAFASTEKTVSGLEKAGSPREIAFNKAQEYYRKGIDAEESLKRAGLPSSTVNIEELKRRTYGYRPGAQEEDKYAKMAKKLGIPDIVDKGEIRSSAWGKNLTRRGIRESFNLEGENTEATIFKGKVRNPTFFVEALRAEKGHDIAETAKRVLDREPLETLNTEKLNVIKNFSLLKDEDELYEFLNSYLKKVYSEELKEENIKKKD